MSLDEFGLYEASMLDDQEFLIKKLEEGSDPNMKSEKGFYPFDAAFECGFFKNAEILVKYGAKIENKNMCVCGFNMPLLHHAAVFGLKIIIDKLLEDGADINSTNDFGVTPLAMSVASNIPNDMFQYLVSKGASVNVKLPDGSSLISALLNANRVEDVKLAILNGADIDEENLPDESAFSHIVDSDEYTLIEAVIEKYPERKEPVKKVLEKKVECLVDFMKNLVNLPPDDEKWTAASDVDKVIEETKSILEKLK